MHEEETPGNPHYDRAVRRLGVVGPVISGACADSGHRESRPGGRGPGGWHPGVELWQQPVPGPSERGPGQDHAPQQAAHRHQFILGGFS